MRLRTVLLGLLGAVAVAIVGAAAVVSRLDFGKYKGVIAERVTRATGRQVTLAGDLTLTLLPAPALTVKDVRFANAGWGSRPAMATLGELSVEIELLPLLLHGDLRVTRLAAKDVDLLLETDANGYGNWQPAAGPPAPAGAAPPATREVELPSFERVTLQNILVTYRDGRTGKATGATVNELSSTGSFGGPLQLKLAAIVQGMTVQATATVGALATLMTHGQPYDVQAEINVAGATATLKGSAREPLAGRGLQFDMTLDGKDLGALAGAALPAKPYHLAATLSGDADQTLTLRPLQASLGASAVTGEASVALGGPRPKLVATLEAPLLDLTELPAAKPAADDRVFPRDPLPVDALRVLDVDVTVSAAALKVEPLALQNLAMRAVLTDRDLKIAPLAIDLGGGHVTGTLELSGRQAPATLAVELSGRQLAVGRLLALLSGDDLLEAKGDAALSVRGAGDSVRALAASLDGTSSLVVGPGVIKSRYADLLGADLFREAFAWAQGKTDTRLNCLVARFDIRKGVATARGMLVDTGEMSMLGEGKVDLGAERLDLELTPRPKETSLLNLAVPIDIGGTFTHPRVQPNKLAAGKAIAIDVASALNPLTLIGKLVLDNASGDNNPCLAALDAKGAAAKQGERGIGGAVKDLGRRIDSLFK